MLSGANQAVSSAISVVLLLIGAQATETAVKAARLDTVSVIAFATHGLVGGAFRGLLEPALVLTPPAIATDADDGLLTASEIAKLRLDADWVILSACDTSAEAESMFDDQAAMLACVVPIDTASAPDWRGLMPMLARLWPGAAAGERTNTHQRGKQ